MDENRKKLYDQLSANYDMGTFDEFDTDLDNEDNQKVAWEAMGGQDGYGDFSMFQQAIARSPQAAEAGTTGNTGTTGSAGSADAATMATAAAEPLQPAWPAQDGTMPGEDDADADISLPDADKPTTPKDQPAGDEEIVNEPAGAAVVPAGDEEQLRVDAVDYSTLSDDELMRNMGVLPGHELTQRDIDGRMTYIASIADPLVQQSEYEKLDKSIGEWNRRIERSTVAAREAAMATSKKEESNVVAQLNENSKYISDEINATLKKDTDVDMSGTSEFTRAMMNDGLFKQFNDIIREIRSNIASWPDERLRQELTNRTFDNEADSMERAVYNVAIAKELEARSRGGHATTVGEDNFAEYIESLRAQDPERARAIEAHADGYDTATRGHASSVQDHGDAALDDNPSYAVPRIAFELLKLRRAELSRRMDALKQGAPGGTTTAAIEAMGYSEMLTAEDYDACFRQAEELFGRDKIQGYNAQIMRRHDETMGEAVARYEREVMSTFMDIVSDDMRPKNNWEYVFGYIVHNNFGSRVLQGLHGALYGAPKGLDFSTVYNSSVEQYTTANSDGAVNVAAQVFAPTATFLLGAGCIGEFFAPNIVGRWTSNFALRAVGGGTAAGMRSMAQKGIVKYGTSMLSTGTNFAAFGLQNELIHQLSTGDVEGVRLLVATLEEGLKGAAFGTATGIMGKLFERATGWKAYVGEAAKIGVEAAAFTGMGYLEARMNGKDGLTLADVGTNIGIVAGSKMSHFKQWSSEVRQRARNEGIYGRKVNYHEISEREREQLESLGYHGVAIALKGSRLSEDQARAIDAELSQMRNDKNVPWELVRCADWVLNGRMSVPPAVSDARVDGDAVNGYVITAVDSTGRAIRGGVTVKGNDAKNAMVRLIKKEADVARYAAREQQMVEAQSARDQAMCAQQFCAMSDGKYTDVGVVLKVFGEALRKVDAKEKLGDVEEEVLTGVGVLLAKMDMSDIVGDRRKQTEQAYKVNLDKAIKKDASERTDAEKAAVKDYDAWLDTNKDLLNLESEQFAEWLRGAGTDGTSPWSSASGDTSAEARGWLTSWSDKIDTSDLVIVESIDQVADAAVREAIKASEREGRKDVPGWSIGGKAYVYLPHIRDKADFDKTVMHELVAHRGLRGLLGENRFNDLCDRVWNSMPAADRARLWNYPSSELAKNERDRQRAVADEYIAQLSERTDAEGLHLWNKFVALLYEHLHVNIMGTGLDAQLREDIRESYRNLREQRGEQAERVAEGEPEHIHEDKPDDGAVPPDDGGTPPEGVADPPAAEGGETPAGGEPPVERPTAAVGRVEGTPADLEDWRELMTLDPDELDSSQVTEGLSLLEAEREQAHRYANGELADEPSNWEYWAARDGLSAPENPGGTPPVGGGGEPPVDGGATPPAGGEPPAGPERPTLSDKPLNELTAEELDGEITRLMEYFDGGGQDADGSLDRRLSELYAEQSRREAEVKEPAEPVEPVGDGTPAETEPRPTEPATAEPAGAATADATSGEQRGEAVDAAVGGDEPREPQLLERPQLSDTDPASMSDADIAAEIEALRGYLNDARTPYDRQLVERRNALYNEQERRSERAALEDEEAERRAAQETDPYYMPMENKGGGRMSPNWRKATAEQIFNHLNDRENASGRDTLDGNIADGVKRAEDKLKAVERREPKGKGRSDAALDKWEKELSEARAQLEKWREVERMRQEQKAAEGDDSDPTWKQAYDAYTSSDEYPSSLEDYVARHLYGTKFKWKDKELERTGGRTHGLGGHLGLGKSEKERRGFFGWIDEKNGSYPESVAEGIHANMPDWMRDRYDTMEVLDAVLSVVGGNPRPRDMVVDYAKRLREQSRDMDEYYADEAAGARGFADAGEMDAYDNMREREATGFHDVAAAGREADGATADLLADAQARLNDPNASEYEKQAARTVLRFRQRGGRGTASPYETTEDDGVRFRVVRDPREVERLERGKKVKRYRAMQLIDGKLYPPMSARVNGQLREPTELGVWEQADENPELARNGKFRLDKGQKGQGTVDAAYNPYFHTSTSAMNDQFSSAWKRPELVVVEVEIPESELTSGYRAEGAKDSVGDTDWKSGSVNNALPADRQRTVTLSRYMKAVRIVPDAEVADMIARQLEGTDIAVPFNVVNENLRGELVKRGVKIGEPEKSNAGRASRAAYEQWKNGGARFRHRAPNGEESNLDERQYDEVRTGNFKRWFGDWENNPENASKVVDANGEPLVVYRGDAPGRYIMDNAQGSFFSDRDDVAKGYAGKDGQINAVYLDIKNPAFMGNEASYNRLRNEINDMMFDFYDMDDSELSSDGRWRALRKYYLDFRNNEGSSVRDFFNDFLPEASEDMSHEELVENMGQALRDLNQFSYREADYRDMDIANPFLRALGYDGVIRDYDKNGQATGKEYITFSPTQIKSATENNGDFSRESGDIRFRIRDDEHRPTFYSNAERAVENVKQGKATAEQWKAMLMKAGGIKAGEDKWMGLTEWLDEHKGQSLTKDEVLQFVRDNGIRMEEVNYGGDEQDRWRRIWDNLSWSELYDTAVRRIEERGGDSEEWDNINDEIQDILTERYGEQVFDHIDYDSEGNIELKGNEIHSIREDYTTPGLANKREIAFVVPGIEPYQENDAVHFGPENEGRAVMWVRFGETTDTDGKRVLVIDEVQSNRHQDAREKGYRDRTVKERYEQAQKAYLDYGNALAEKYNVPKNLVFTSANDAERKQMRSLLKAEQEAHRAYKESYSVYSTAVPAAPFEKNWMEVAMKRMLRLAAEEGFDKVAWTTGAQQASRYNLNKVIDRIWHTDDLKYVDGGKRVMLRKDEGLVIPFTVDSDGIVAKGYSGNSIEIPEGTRLSDVVGKELADKIMSGSGEVIENPFKERFPDLVMKEISGDGLRIGGDGMKGFYDEMLPRFMNKYGKKWGAKVGEVELATPGGEVMHSVDVTEPMRESVMQGQPLFRIRGEHETGDRVRVRREGMNDGRVRVEGLPGEWRNIDEAGRAMQLSDPEHMYVPSDDGKWLDVYDWRDNEVWDIWRGKPGSKRFEKWRERTLNHIHKQVPEYAKKLGLDVELIEDEAAVPAGHEREKSWRDPETGKIYIVVPRHAAFDVSDVMSSLWHEGVSRHGLRKLVGDDNYDTFLDNVYTTSDASIRAEIDRLAEEVTDGDRRGATEEYLSRLAEQMGFQYYKDGSVPVSSWMQRGLKVMRENFDKLCRHLGLFDMTATLRDDDLRAVLYDSYHHLLAENRDAYAAAKRAEREDKEYVKAVKRGDIDTAMTMLHRKLAASEGVVGYAVAHGHGGNHREVSHRLKDSESGAIEQAARDMAQYVPKDAVLVPMPPHEGVVRKDTDTWLLAQELSRLTGAPVVAALRGRERESRYAAKQAGRKGLSADELGFYQDMELPDGKTPVFVDNVVGSGETAKAATQAMGGRGMTLAYTKGNLGKPTEGLKNVTVTYDDAGNLIPLSERFDRSNSDVRFRVRDGRHGSDGIEGPRGEHEAAVEDARRRLESGDASEFERTAARAVIKAYGGGSDDAPDTPGGGVRFRTRDDADMLVDMAKHNNEVARQRRDAVTDFVKAVTDVDELTDSKFATALGKVMRGQRQYDQATVADITTMVKAMMDAGLLTELDNFSVKQILTKVKDSTGKNDITAEANKLIDIMLKHQLRRGKRAFEQQLKVKGMRQDSRGVVVQGGLDYHGQRAAKALKEGLSLGDLQAVNDRIDEAEQRLSDPDEVVRGNAADELEGLYIARQYYDEIKQSEINEANIKSQLEQAQSDHKNGTLSDEAYKQLRQASNDALRELRCERVDAWARLNEQLSDRQSESAERAKQFREQQKQRQAEIQHWANSDMEGHSADPHEQETQKKSAGDKARDVAQAVLQPLGTFNKLMRYFGNAHPKGEGYLFGFVRRFMNVRDQWFKERKADFDQMDTAARRIGAAHGARVKVKVAGGKIATRSIKDWADVYTYINQQKPLTVTVKGKDYEITQGNAAYLLAMEGQADGRMKLRTMGLTEADMDALRGQVDPMLLELSDWVIHGLLPGMRPRLNATHLRMFGADMTDIPNYFPIRTSELARNETVNLAQQNGKIRPATITGSIIERKRNNLDLDLGADFFQVTAEHIDEMNHWNSFAEFARDLNTLLSYKRFKAQVHNLHSWRYGNGADIWKTLEDTAAITTGDYQPKTSKADTIINGATKGLAAANITFRPYTGLKQLLSAPVYLVQARWDDIGYSLANLKDTWQWAIKNLPTFAERWQGRMAGDPILTQAEQERGSQNKKLRWLSKAGFAFNAYVDAVTVAIGARAIYRTKYRRYKDMGYSEEQANQKALEDASISVNETQQSGLGAFTSVIQQDRTFWSRALTIYRNASMGYQRQLVEGLKAMRNGVSAEWRATAREKVQKKLERDGIDSAMAAKVADRLANREAMRGLALAAMFGSIAPFVWALGMQYLGYKMAGGDDDEQEDKMLGQASTHLLSGWAEGIVFGGQLSSAADFAYDYFHGRKKLRDYSLQRDLVSDMAEQILGKSSGKPADAVYDIVNMMVAMSTGVNPKSIVEPTVGIIDVVQNWGGDAKLAHEVALGWCRLLNVPQTSLDQVYIDEIGLSAKDAKQLTAEQFAERWCRYKRRRGAGWMSALTSEESDKEQEGKLLKRYERMMDERFESLSDERVEQIMESDDELLKKHAVKAYKSRIDALSDDEVAAAMVPLSDSAPQDSVDVKREGIKRAYKSEGMSYDTPSDREKNAQAYERHATMTDIAEDTALKGRRDALKKSVGDEFEKMGAEYKKGSRGWGWYIPDSAKSRADEIHAYKKAHEAELDEYGILLKWFGSSKGSSGYIKKGFTDGKHDADEVMKEYREARKEVLAKTKQR